MEIKGNGAADVEKAMIVTLETLVLGSMMASWA